MFVHAVDRASEFTFPYVALRQRADGAVYTMLAAFVVVNEQGWIVTSAHVIEELLSSRQRAEAPGDPVDAAERVVQSSEMWALPGFGKFKPNLVSGRVNPAADLAIGRLEPFDPDVVKEFPVFRDATAEPLRQGQSVCRFGFPFHAVNAAYDAADSEFKVASDAFPVPSFALDGTIARFNRRTNANGASGMFVETSTPGLRGQSGGPLLDLDGRVCGIQSHTAHLDLGFNAAYADPQGSLVTERQFLNVGLASHVDEVRALLDVDGVSYQVG